MQTRVISRNCSARGDAKRAPAPRLTTMLHVLKQIARTGIVTEPAPAPAEEAVLHRQAPGAGAAHDRPRTDHPSRRRRLVQRLRAGNPRAGQSVLQHRGPRHPLRRQSAACRPAAGDRPGIQAHGDRAAAHLRRDAGPQAGGRRRRLRLHRRHLRRELREPGPGRQRDPGRRRNPRLPADAHGAAAGHPRGDRTPARPAAPGRARCRGPRGLIQQVAGKLAGSRPASVAASDFAARRLASVSSTGRR